MRYVLLLFLVLLLALPSVAPVYGQWGEREALAVDQMAAEDAVVRTRAGLDEDYRLAAMLIARTQQRRAEAARLQAAALEIDANNARLREFVCSRFCRAQPTPAPSQFPFPFPRVPEFPMSREGLTPAPLDPALFPQPLPYEPPARVEIDANVWRGAGYRGQGTFNVQVIPQTTNRRW